VLLSCTIREKRACQLDPARKEVAPRLTKSCTDKKENQISLLYKEIQSGAVAKSYMRKGFLIYEEMGKYFPIHGWGGR
jgi:hypothetical protein